MSCLEQVGLSLSLFRPTIVVGTSYTPKGAAALEGVESLISTYSHMITANGGYWSASITIQDDLQGLEDFISSVGWHMETYNPGMDKVFEGFVNRVELSAGPLSFSRGPLMGVANRLSVTYTPIIDPTTIPPTMGTQTVTPIAEDAASQREYAILEDVVSGGRLLDDGTTDAAEQYRDTLLADMAQPESSGNLSVGSSSTPSVTLEILGYVHWLKKYMVQDLTNTTISIANKIQQTLGADPNGMFSTDYSLITNNAFLVHRYEDDLRSAWDIIQEVVEIGDASANRYTFGIYDGIQAAYDAVPTSTEYQQRILSPNMQVELTSGVPVDPWDVRPARWLFMPDFLPGLGVPGTPDREDPRYVFIESVQYTAPNQIEITGSKVSTIPQLIAQQGMWG